MRGKFLFLEALIFCAPTTLVFLYGLPYILGGSLYQLLDGNPQAAIGAAGCIWALFEFWKLAIYTALQQVYWFGPSFISALIGALVGIVVMHQGIPYDVFAVLVGLPLSVTLHFSYEQSRLRKRSSI